MDWDPTEQQIVLKLKGEEHKDLTQEDAKTF
jgi:hypothetical protein